MSACRACLEPVLPSKSIDGFHRGCLVALFGVARVPRVDFELRTLHTVGLEIAGKVALSGVQRKVAVRLDDENAALIPAPRGSRFILKPQAQAFPHVPENEHLTMRLAEKCGVAIPPCALLPLADGSTAYVVRRFDRMEEGRKVRVEDFCQLAEQPSKDRYEGSAELCARLVRRYASEPLIEALKLFRQTVFSWWAGNGDMHLKNLSLLATSDGLWQLSPAYDLLNSEIILGQDDLSLSVGGKKRNLTARIWREYGAYLGLPEKLVRKELTRLASLLEPSLEVVARSALPENLRRAYAEGLTARAKVLG